MSPETSLIKWTRPSFSTGWRVSPIRTSVSFLGNCNCPFALQVQTSITLRLPIELSSDSEGLGSAIPILPRSPTPHSRSTHRSRFKSHLLSRCRILRCRSYSICIFILIRRIMVFAHPDVLDLLFSLAFICLIVKSLFRVQLLVTVQLISFASSYSFSAFDQSLSA